MCFQSTQQTTNQPNNHKHRQFVNSFYSIDAIPIFASNTSVNSIIIIYRFNIFYRQDTRSTLSHCLNYSGGAFLLSGGTCCTDGVTFGIKESTLPCQFHPWVQGWVWEPRFTVVSWKVTFPVFRKDVSSNGRFPQSHSRKDISRTKVHYDLGLFLFNGRLFRCLLL